jgi:hypothetical protein
MSGVIPTPMSSDPAEFDGTHIIFRICVEPGDKRKTAIWLVASKYGGDPLGYVKWFARWRKYSFFPADGCVFEGTCMRELSQFIEDRTREHKTGI